MRAIVQERYGPPDVLELKEVATPAPGDGEVLIRVEAASLNVYDWHMTTGTPYMARAMAGLSKPKQPIPGADVSGVVVAVGSDVTRLSSGDEVFGEIGHGAFAEYAVAKERGLALKPRGVTFEQAAAVPMAGLTALQGLRDRGRVDAGQRVIVNGASGGVGTFAIQIAKALGAEVTAVCSTTKTETASMIGADRVIDYTKEDYTATERGYDVLFDNAGNRPWSETSRVLSDGGINVTITGPKHRWFGPLRHLLVRKLAAAFGSKRLTWFTAQVKREDLELLAALLQSGDLAPVIEATYPLERVPDALRYLNEGHAHGKLVVTR
jgi:NADPH:quinone reductase-like Zn-dependent oxidoreductase